MEQLYLVMKELGIDLKDYGGDEQLSDRLQSLVYLLSMNGGPLHYNFEIYKIGPYSQHANMEAQKIAAGAIVNKELTLNESEIKILQMVKEALKREEEEKGFLKCLSLIAFLQTEGFTSEEAIEEIIRETTYYDFTKTQIEEGVAFLSGYNLN